MGNINFLSDLQYADEHFVCRQYMDESCDGFRYDEMEEGEFFHGNENSSHNILIFVEGDFRISSGVYSDRVFHAGEMVLVPRTSTYAGVALTKARMVIFQFESPEGGCEKLVLQSYWDLCRDIDYDFRATEVRDPFPSFLGLLIYCLKNRMNCTQLHAIKHREFFLYLRGYYTKEEVARLLYPIIGRSLDFRDFILKNYKKARTIEELADLSNMGRSTFFKKFKGEFGVSVKQWLAKQKIQDIAYLAINPELSIKEIMYQCGFDTTTQFNRFCRQYADCTAKELLVRIRG